MDASCTETQNATAGPLTATQLYPLGLLAVQKIHSTAGTQLNQCHGPWKCQPFLFLNQSHHCDSTNCRPTRRAVPPTVIQTTADTATAQTQAAVHFATTENHCSTCNETTETTAVHQTNSWLDAGTAHGQTDWETACRQCHKANSSSNTLCCHQVPLQRMQYNHRNHCGT
jgi:hypothetical protein